MARITTNPQADADTEFDVAAPGVHLLRIEGSANFQAVSEFDSKSTPGNKGLKIRFVFADPTAVTTTEGQVAKNLGSIIDQSCIYFPEDKQGKLRSLVEAAGMAWADFDSQDLVGREVLCKVGLDTYNGTTRNKIERYIKPKV